MKLKSFAMISAICAGSVSLASAQQYVYLTGSTAFRGTVYATLNSTAVFDTAPTFVGYNGSSASGCNFMLFSNTIASTPTIIKCHWSGSEAGILDVSSSTQESFLSDTVIPGGTQLGTTPSGSQLITNGVDLAMADNAVAFSQNPGSSASQTFVGVIPFSWVRGSNNLASVSNLTNVTDQQIRKALAGGQKLALFTGVPTDTTNYVYVSGRDNGSGTRVNAFGISGYGIKTPPFQIELDGTGNMINLDGAGTYDGDYGFSSGGTLAGTLGIDTSGSADQVHTGNTGFVTIAYLGRSDANTAVNKGGIELSYNGVKESPTTIMEGQYGFWGNEYVLQRSGASSQAQAVYTKLKATTGIPASCDGVIAFNNTQMHATRGGPTTDPQHK